MNNSFTKIKTLLSKWPTLEVFHNNTVKFFVEIWQHVVPHLEQKP